MIFVLVTGANGQLGSEIKRQSAAFPEMTFLFTDVAGPGISDIPEADGTLAKESGPSLTLELDITNATTLKDFLDSNPVEYIVNCAAYTAVDKAEDEPETAELINGTAVGILAREAAGRDIQLIHVSTDYVFDGEKNFPYREEDPVNPCTAYGKSKLSGEKAVRESGKGIIIRTAWLYSVFGKNFVKTILRYSREKEELRVVFDQTGSPTNASDLAGAILAMIRTDRNRGKASRYDLYHYSNLGMCSWFEFAQEIVTYSGTDCRVEPVPSVDYPTTAKRPRYSVFDKNKILSDYPLDIPHWKDSLSQCLAELANQ